MRSRSSTRLLSLAAVAAWAAGEPCRLTVPLMESSSHLVISGDVLGLELYTYEPTAPPGAVLGGNITLELVDYQNGCPNWKDVGDADAFWSSARFAMNATVEVRDPVVVVKAANIPVEMRNIAAHVYTDVLQQTQEGFHGLGQMRIIRGQSMAMHRDYTMVAPEYSEIELKGRVAACRDLPNLELEMETTGITHPDSVPGKKSHIDFTGNIKAQRLSGNEAAADAIISSVEPPMGRWNESTLVTITGVGLVDSEGRPVEIMVKTMMGVLHPCRPPPPSVLAAAAAAADAENSRHGRHLRHGGGGEVPHDTIQCMIPEGIPGEAVQVQLAAGLSCGSEPVLFSYSESSCPTSAHAGCMHLDNAVYDMDTCMCSCVDGFRGEYCNMCDESAPNACGVGSSCFAGAFDFFPIDHSTKTYECIPADLPDAFKQVSVSIACSPLEDELGTCELHVGGQTMGKPIACYAHGCRFGDGTPMAKCEAVTCDMGEYKEIIKAILGHDTIEGSSTFTCGQVDGNGRSRCVLQVTDLPIPISADCQVSECLDDVTLAAVRHMKAMRTAMRSIFVALAFAFVVAVPLFLYLDLRKPRAIALVRASVEDQVNGAPRKALTLRRDTADVHSNPMGGRRETTIEHHVTELHFKDLCVEAGSGRYILNDISGVARAGELLGVMGPSGSGKTTLLDVLAGLVPGGARATGQVLADDEQLTVGAHYPPSLIAYCQQSDLLPGTMSVLECVTFAAMLTLPMTMDKDEKLRRAIDAIDELALSHVADSIVGDATAATSSQRVSGGERRRISLAMSIVAHPAILLCDEVTSGLDSTTAFLMVRTLRGLARRGRIVVLSIHQPSSRAFMGLDRLLLLRSGEVVLASPTKKLVQVCEASGLPCEPGINMADHLLDVIVSDKQAARLRQHCTWEDLAGGGSSQLNVPQPRPPRMPTSQSVDSVASLMNSDKDQDWGAKLARARLEVATLYWRYAVEVVRHKSLLRLHLLVAIGAALAVGILFHGLGNDVSGLQNRVGAVFFVLALFGFSGLSAMEVFMSEMALSLREMRSGYYALPSILLTKLSLDALILRVVPAFAFAAIFYPLVNFDPAVNHFIVFLAITVFVNVAAGTLVAALSIPFDSLGSANLCATILMLVLLLLNGALLNMSSAPAPIAVFQSLSFFRYGFEAMLTNELRDKVVMVEAPGLDPFPLSANLFLALLGVKPDRVWSDVFMLAVFALLHCAFAYYLLKQKTKRNQEPEPSKMMNMFTGIFKGPSRNPERFDRLV